MEKLWVVRSSNGEFIDTFLSKSIVGLGWCLETNFSNFDLTEIKKVLLETYPTKEKSIPTWAGMINNFVNKMNIGDFVITYEPSSRNYYVGKIISDYSYNSKIIDCPQTRKIQWFSEQISRDLLSNDLKNSLGSTLTLFQLKKEQEKERRLQKSILDIKKKYGKNAVLRGLSYEEGATTRTRNGQIGGHKA